MDRRRKTNLLSLSLLLKIQSHARMSIFNFDMWSPASTCCEPALSSAVYTQCIISIRNAVAQIEGARGREAISWVRKRIQLSAEMDINVVVCDGWTRDKIGIVLYDSQQESK